MVLDIECLDRIYLNAYVPILQSSGQVVAFMTQHLGMPIPSPALMEQDRARGSAGRWTPSPMPNGIPWVKFGKDDRKIDVMPPYLEAAGRHRAVRGGGDRRGAGVPAGLGRLPARHPDRGAAVHLRQG